MLVPTVSEDYGAAVRCLFDCLMVNETHDSRP